MDLSAIVEGLTGVLVPVGYVGAAIAAVCGVLGVIGFARWSEGLIGGAVAVWIGGAMLSATAGFGGQWIPLFVAGGALVLALVVGPLVRLAVVAAARRAETRAAALEEAALVETVTVDAMDAAAPSIQNAAASGAESHAEDADAPASARSAIAGALRRLPGKRKPAPASV